MKVGDRFDAFVEVRQTELLVGGMEVVAVEAETHEHDLYSQVLFEQGTDGNAAAAADGDRGLMEGSFDGLRRGPVRFAVNGCHIGLAAVMLFGPHGNAGWRDLPEIVQQLLRDHRRTLVGHQAGRDLRRGLRG